MNIASLLLLAMLAVFGEFRALAQNAEPCADGDALIDEGSQSGCVRTEAGGRQVRYGNWTVWDDQSRIQQEVHYNQSGEQDGPTRYYFQPGNKLKSEAFYQGGKPTGTWSFWDESGEKREERQYRAGRLHGIRKHWTAEGKPAGMECFVSGERRAIGLCSRVDFAAEDQAQNPRSGRSPAGKR